MKETHHGFKFLPLLLAVFAICVAAATWAAEQAYLGVILQPLTIDLKEAMDVDRDLRGVLISDVIDESPADQYGLEDGDIIIEIGGEEVVSVKEAVSAIKSHSPGDEVKIVVLRDGDKKDVVAVTLGERGEEEEYEAFDFESLPDLKHHIKKFPKELKEFHHKQGYLGVRVEDISSSDLGDYFGVKKGEGVLVVEVLEDSPAEEAGLKAGDVITEFDGKEISSADQLVKYVRKTEPDDEVDITYMRKRQTKTVEVEIGEAKTSLSLFIGGMGFPGECHTKKILIPGIGGIKKKIEAYHKDSDEDHDWIRIYGKDLDDLEGDIEVYRMDRSELEDALEDLKEDMEELKKELEELKKVKD